MKNRVTEIDCCPLKIKTKAVKSASLCAGRGSRLGYFIQSALNCVNDTTAEKENIYSLILVQFCNFWTEWKALITIYNTILVALENTQAEFYLESFCFNLHHFRSCTHVMRTLTRVWYSFTTFFFMELPRKTTHF